MQVQPSGVRFFAGIAVGCWALVFLRLFGGGTEPDLGLGRPAGGGVCDSGAAGDLALYAGLCLFFPVVCALLSGGVAGLAGAGGAGGGHASQRCADTGSNANVNITR